jgi:hypothetical protein
VPLVARSSDPCPHWADDREWLMRELEVRWLDLGRTEYAGWPAWNLARQRAGEALAPLSGGR